MAFRVCFVLLLKDMAIALQHTFVWGTDQYVLVTIYLDCDSFTQSLGAFPNFALKLVVNSAGEENPV